MSYCKTQISNLVCLLCTKTTQLLEEPVWTFATERATGERLEKFGFVQGPFFDEIPGAPKACGWTR